MTSDPSPFSTFRQVKDQVFSDPYPLPLPMHVITLGSFYKGVTNMLLKACHRTLSDHSDIVPWFQKLVHPNGVALSGTWKITEESPYTGFFSKGSEALIMVRCSCLLFQTGRGSNRAFAFAGKIFPTMDPDKPVQTADFLTIDVLAGTKAPHFTDVALTNEPPLGFNMDVVHLFGVVIATFGSFIRANFNPVFRPTYPIGELGLPDGAPSNSPRWIMIKAWSGSGQSEEPDFRNELRVQNYKDSTLRFILSGASDKLPAGDRNWIQLGHIDLTDSVVSDSCDHRLAFHHPKLRRNHP